jgi:hypothetical protein
MLILSALGECRLHHRSEGQQPELTLVTTLAGLCLRHRTGIQAQRQQRRNAQPRSMAASRGSCDADPPGWSRRENSSARRPAAVTVGLQLPPNRAMSTADRSKRAFERLYERTSRRLLIHLVRRLHDVEAATELWAECWAAAFAGWSRCRASTPAEEEAWLFGIARRQRAAYYRTARSADARSSGCAGRRPWWSMPMSGRNSSVWPSLKRSGRCSHRHSGSCRRNAGERWSCGSGPDCPTSRSRHRWAALSQPRERASRVACAA